MDNKTLKEQKSAALTIFTVALLTDIFFISTSSDFIIFGLLGCYGMGILIFKLSSTTTFYLCLILLILAYIQFLLFGPAPITEKTSVWFVLFFIVGVAQRFRE